MSMSIYDHRNYRIVYSQSRPQVELSVVSLNSCIHINYATLPSVCLVHVAGSIHCSLEPRCPRAL